MIRKRLALLLAVQWIILLAVFALAKPGKAEADTETNGGNFMIQAGDGFTVALRHDGTVWTWGLNDKGQLGDGTNSSRNIPLQIGLSNVVSIASGCSHTLALTSDGNVWAWGANIDGQLGVGSTDSNMPVPVPGLTDVVAMDAGLAQTAMISREPGFGFPFFIGHDNRS